MKRILPAAICCCVFSIVTFATDASAQLSSGHQGNGNPSNVQHADYAAAEKFDVPNLSRMFGQTEIIPFFKDKTEVFWFATQDQGKRMSYVIDPVKKKRYPMLDVQQVSRQLAAMGVEVTDTPAINGFPEFGRHPDVVRFDYKNQRYLYNYRLKTLKRDTAKQTAPVYVDRPVGDFSPDQRWLVYSKDHNLFLKEMKSTETDRQLSTDGERYYSVSINKDEENSGRPSPTEVKWLNDEVFYVLREDSRQVRTMSVINSVGWMGPSVNTYKYEFPGDEKVVQYELLLGSVNSGQLVKANIGKWQDQEVTLVPCKGSSEIYFIRKKRTRDEMELCAVNPATGAVRMIVHELSKPYINEDLSDIRILNKGKDILWWSDRTGWGHYYLYGNDGTLKNTLTSGSWTAGRIIHIDTQKREIIFYGYGKESGRNPYLAHAYLSAFDQGQPKLLTPENANHKVFVSSSGNYLIDNYSRIDLDPLTVLRSRKGTLIMELFKPDLSKLYAYGWKKPEPFKIKAKDGVTDLYGILWKPYNFDASRKYPIISQVYPGPQIETVWPDFTVFDRYNNTSLAQLGCIVVVMGHRGGSPVRNSAYYKFGYGNLRDYALEDDKYGLEQLAARYPFIDLNKVGITGHSGGGAMAAAAICTYPDFYKVAVASSGNYDNSIYNRTWGETYEGVQSRTDSSDHDQPAREKFEFNAKTGQSLAKQLKGKLLMVAGESDANVNPSNTMKMADALIQADKDFEMLILPGQSHTYEGPYKKYYQMKQRKFFGDNLIEK